MAFIMTLKVICSGKPNYNTTILCFFKFFGMFGRTLESCIVAKISTPNLISRVISLDKCGEERSCFCNIPIDLEKNTVNHTPSNPSKPSCSCQIDGNRLKCRLPPVTIINHSGMLQQ